MQVHIDTTPLNDPQASLLPPKLPPAEPPRTVRILRRCGSHLFGRPHLQVMARIALHALPLAPLHPSPLRNEDAHSPRGRSCPFPLLPVVITHDAPDETDNSHNDDHDDAGFGWLAEAGQEGVGVGSRGSCLPTLL